MELKVGMYVKTKSFKGFPSKIDKIRDIEYNQGPDRNETYIALEKDEEKCRRWTKDYIVGEPSENIIELLEVGDYVEIEYYSLRYEQRVKRIFEVDYRHNEYLGLKNAYCDFMLVNNEFREIDRSLNPIIKSVVTKEQFDSVRYEVE